MVLPNIETTEQITDDRVEYLAGLAQTLATQNDFIIQNFSDSVVTSPDVQSILQSEGSISLLEDVPPQDALSDIFYPGDGNIETFALSLPQQNALFPELRQKIKNLFSNLRRKVKRIFCRVASTLSDDEELDLKQIIRQVLSALVPALAASAGLMPVALPIVVSLAAMVIKYGVATVCPN